MLKLTDVCKTFGTGTVIEKKALDNLSLEVSEADFITVIGGNGAGKSTLFNCIAGVYPIDKGTVEINGTDVSKVPEFKRSKYIGRVFQDPLKGTAFDMTIEENLAIAYVKDSRHGLLPGVSGKDTKFFRDKLALLELGLEDRMKHKVGLLSGGQRQALTLLMATIVKPKLLLLDEHTAALDPAIAKKVLSLTKSIVESENLTTIMITHNMKSALDYGNRTVMMHEGKIILDIGGAEREAFTVEKLIEQFERKSGEELDNDRMLLG